MKKRIFHIFSLLLLLGGLSSCKDDLVLSPNEYGEGESVISAQITFNPLTGTSLSRATGGTPGEAIKTINNLTVLLYDTDNNLVGQPFYFFGDDLPEAKDNTAIAQDGVVKGEHGTQEVTSSVTVNLPGVAFGQYYLYAVANVDKDLLAPEDVATVNDLKSMIFEWQTDEIADNNQMFGYFSTENKSKGFEAELIGVNRPAMELHAWIRRLASKVTVAFDGSGLYDGVQIYLKSVAIRDIPRYCYLGRTNTPPNDLPVGVTASGTEGEITLDDALIRTSSNQVMYYWPDGTNAEDLTSESYTPGSWPSLITNAKGPGHDLYGYGYKDGSTIESLHSEETNALFFYENMQGKGEENTPTDKRQQVNDVHKANQVVSYPNGSDPSDIAWKDAKKWGTYIEVRAYYKCFQPGSTTELDPEEGEGEIIYRFMLGKDTHLDYNAERNYHYKLTLKFRGYANDVDWHIDYRHSTDELRLPNPFWISYLYGQNTMMPIEFDADEDWEIQSIKAEIKSNNWAPNVEGFPNSYPCLLQPPTQPSAADYETYWLYVKAMDEPEKRPYNGFLSLQKPPNLIAVRPDESNLTAAGKPILSEDINKLPYEHNINNGIREYTADELKISTIPVYQAQTQDRAHVAWEDGTYYVKLPIWTRPKLLIKETGYTGNNPYTTYYRDAKVHLTVKLVNTKTNETKTLEKMIDQHGNEHNDVLVRQVRRLINPKGVWRKANSRESFHVVLKTLEGESSTQFTNIISDGPWRAYVLHDTEATDEDGSGGFVSLRGANGTTTATTTFMFNEVTDGPNKDRVYTRRCIEGVGNTPIDFTINFANDKNPAQNEHALIRVEYNNYTCYHLIFVRRGYLPEDIDGCGKQWLVFNNISKDEVTSDPRDEGSLFKFGNWGGIPTEYNVNNDSKGTYWNMIVPNDYTENALNDTQIKLTDGTTKTFAGITTPYVQGKVNTAKFEEPTGMRVATYEDFYGHLAPEGEDNQNFAIKTGFGVLYADGAGETLEDMNQVYGYKAGGPTNYGMRGVFAYDMDTGKNIFFPIGSSGYGHRKSSLNNGSKNLSGVLRYSCNGRWGYFNAITAEYKVGMYGAPLLFDVFRSDGAIYYFGEQGPEKANESGQYYLGWDMNFYTLDFNRIGDSDITFGDDACFVRCIAD